MYKFINRSISVTFPLRQAYFNLTVFKIITSYPPWTFQPLLYNTHTKNILFSALYGGKIDLMQ